MRPILHYCKFRSILLVCGLLLANAIAGWAEPVTVRYKNSVSITVAGATAAFPLEPLIADAWAQDGTVTITGKSPGTTHIVVVTPGGSQSLDVVIPEPPPSYPPGFVKPSPFVGATQYGSYEFRYSSDPSQLQNVLNLSYQGPQRTVRFRLVNANSLPGNRRQPDPSPGFSPVNFPSAYYQIIDPNREITFLDQEVLNSPLTVNGSIIRGFHLRQGPWLLHAGYTSVASFQTLFLPADREGVFGMGYRHPIGAHGTLTHNLYFFPQQHGFSSRRGIVGSVVYEYKPGDDLRILAELGASRGLGAAAQFDYNRPGNSIRANFRYEPKHFASVGVNNLHGLFADVLWGHEVTPRLSLDLNLSAKHYVLPGFEQTNRISRLGAHYRLGSNWVFSSGIGYGGFSSSTASTLRVRSMNLPAGISFHSRHFGASFHYQYARNFGEDLGGHDFRPVLRASWKYFQVSVFGDRQTQAPTLAYIYSQTPGLREALERLGLAATTPEQIADLYEQNTALLALGYLRQATVNISPLRLQAGGSLSLTMPGQWSPRLNLDFLYNSNQSVTSTVQTAIPAITYSQRLGDSLELFLTYSMFRTKLPGKVSEHRSLFAISARYQFSRTPGFLIAERHGRISGVVFLDKSGAGIYQPGMPTLAGVEVILDGNQHSRTDRYGFYSFSAALYSAHRVEIVHHSEKTFFYSTPAQVDVPADTTVNFGIGVASSQLFGYVRTDAATGISGVELIVVGGNQRYTTTTNSEGKFAVSGLSAGEYEVIVNPDSIPPGYSLEHLSPVKTTLAPDSPKEVAILIHAIRNVSGRVRLYDRTLGIQIPMPGQSVTLLELSRTSSTDADGAFLFRGLPAGKYSLAVSHEGKEFTQEVILSEGPAFLKDVDFNVGAR